MDSILILEHSYDRSWITRYLLDQEEGLLLCCLIFCRKIGAGLKNADRTRKIQALVTITHSWSLVYLGDFIVVLKTLEIVSSNQEPRILCRD